MNTLDINGSSLPVTRDPLVEEALERWKETEAHHDKILRESELDHGFFLGGRHQWDADVYDTLTKDSTPALTFNGLQQYVYNVLNAQLQNPSEIAINPEGRGANDMSARIRQDLIRQIRTKQQGNVAVNRAYLDCIIGGFGYFRLGTAYVSDRSMNQRITMEPIKSCFSVRYDPNAMYPTYRDADYCFVFDDISRREFKRKYPKSTMASIDTPDKLAIDWVQANNVRLAEYFKAKYKKRTAVALQDGSVEYADEMELQDIEKFAMRGEDGLPVSREFEERTVWRSMINAYEVLEPEVKWLTKFIPIIPVLGEERILKGERHILGLIRNARDPQTASNFMQNAEIVAIQASSKTPWLVEENQIGEHASFWQKAHRKVFAFLPYKRWFKGEGMAEPVDLGVPQRNNAEPPIQAMEAAIVRQNMNLQQSMGKYEPSLGKEGPEESAAAILARQHQGALADYRFQDSLNRALAYAGEQLLEMIPQVYDANQILRLEGADQKPYAAQVYNSQAQGNDQVMLEQGVKAVLDLSEGDFTVEVSIAPARETQQQEAQQVFSALAQSAPELVPKFAYIWASVLNIPQKDELVRALTPPEVLAQQGDGAAMAMQQNQHLQQQVQHLAVLVQQLVQEKQAKVLELQHKGVIVNNEIASKERIAQGKNATDLIIEAAQAKQANAQAMLDSEVNRIEGHLDRQHEVHMAIFNAGNAAASQESAQDAAADQQQQSQQQEAAQ